MSKTAHILCIAAGYGDGLHAPAIGFHPLRSPLGEALNGDLWIGHRPKLEKLQCTSTAQPNPAAGAIGVASIDDHNRGQTAYPAYVQIIPYFLFRHNDRYLRYVRTTAGGDERLHGLISIGIGGHVDLEDVETAADGSIDLLATIEVAGRREGREEVGVEISIDGFRWVGTIYATENEVDRVHLGVVGIYDLTDDQAAAIYANQEIGEHAFKTMPEILEEVRAKDGMNLETWTRLIIESNPSL